MDPDFTYIWTAEGWLRVAALLDLFSRRVVGRSMSAGMTAQLVTDHGDLAQRQTGCAAAPIRPGSQYTSEQFQRLLADNGVVCSMSRSGNVWDNAASFFSSRKTERDLSHAQRGQGRRVRLYRGFYNPKRRHSTLGYLRPVEFEMQAQFVRVLSTKPVADQLANFNPLG
jgi:putative transposase